MTPNTKSEAAEWVADFRKKLCCTLPDGTEVVGCHDTGEDREAEYDFWQSYKVEQFIAHQRQEAQAALLRRVLEATEQQLPNLSKFDGSHTRLRFWQGFRKGVEAAAADIRAIAKEEGIELNQL